MSRLPGVIEEGKKEFHGGPWSDPGESPPGESEQWRGNLGVGAGTLAGGRPVKQSGSASPWLVLLCHSEGIPRQAAIDGEEFSCK